MKFTSEDLMKAMGLSVGDRVKVKLGIGLDILSNSNNYVVEIFKDTTGIIMIKNDKNQSIFLTNLIGYDFEILPRPKRVGDLKCDGKCLLCPCIYVCNDEINAVNKTLYEILELGIATFTKTPQEMNKEIHDVIKARLDKEVKE